MARSKRPKCPSCGSSDAIRIMWGLPDPQFVFENEIAGNDIEYRGCDIVVSDDMPEPATHRCKDCGGSYVAGKRWVLPGTIEDDV